MTKITTYIKAHKLLIAVGILVLAGLIFVFVRNDEKMEDSYTVAKEDFVKTVTVSGKVIPSESVDLSFDIGGTIAYVNKKAGDKVFKGEVIASLDASEIAASRQKAEADLLSARAELLKLQSSETNSSAELFSDKQEIINSIIDAYTKADDAVHNKVDQYFSDFDGNIQYTFDDYFSQKQKINDGRDSIEKVLVAWKPLVNSLTVSNYDREDLNVSTKNLTSVRAFLELVAPAVNTCEESDTLSQATIEKYRSDLSTARNNINEAVADLASAEEKLKGTTSDIPVQEANVKAAEATVENFKAQISNTVIRAPFTGVVSLQDAKVGEAVSAHTKVSSMISSGYEIEAYIPEMVVGNTAEIKLDAYLNDKFDAVISYIDPAETIKDGVSNYKIRLTFLEQDPKIKPGMTADVTIQTEKRPDTIIVLERSMINDGGKYYVFKKNDKEVVKTEITIGTKDGKGKVEVIGGVSVGDVIMINPEGN